MIADPKVGMRVKCIDYPDEEDGINSSEVIRHKGRIVRLTVGPFPIVVLLNEGLETEDEVQFSCAELEEWTLEQQSREEHAEKYL